MSSGAVTVCACTHRRPDGLKNLLDGLARQRFGRIPPPEWGIVIVDNEGSAAARQVCDEFLKSSPIPLTYVHEPRLGIPHARNACLDQLSPSTEFFAMIDDDEVPEPDWLEQLLLAQAATGSDVIQGRVVPEFPHDTPDWIKNGGFFGVPHNNPHSKRTQWIDGQLLDRAATNNVLVQWPSVYEIGGRFDERLALTGGEDTLFFFQLREAGLTISYAEKAIVHEQLPAERLCLKYLMQAQYRRGHNKLYRKLALNTQPIHRGDRYKRCIKQAFKGLTRVVDGTTYVIISFLKGRAERERLALGLMRSAHGLGMVASTLGLKNKHYL